MTQAGCSIASRIVGRVIRSGRTKPLRRLRSRFDDTGTSGVVVASGSKNGYTLKKQTTQQYIDDLRFQTIGVAVKVNDGKTKSFSGMPDATKEWLLQ